MKEVRRNENRNEYEFVIKAMFFNLIHLTRKIIFHINFKLS